jgi:hypothetical protein
MYDSRLDWRKPGRDYLDPELENISASSLIDSHKPHRYALAAFEVGTACLIAGAILLLLSVYGSTSWGFTIPPEESRSLLMTTVTGMGLSAVGILVAMVSWLRLNSETKKRPRYG